MTKFDLLLKHQHDYIQREFGEEAAVHANYAWGSRVTMGLDCDNYVETKIYGDIAIPTLILVSQYEEGNIVDTIEPYIPTQLEHRILLSLWQTLV